MGQLENYSDLQEKNKQFSRKQEFSIIDTIEEFDKWYKTLKESSSKVSSKSKISSVNTNKMYRGMSESKYKLLTSSQRFWILNELEQWWRPKRYLEFIETFVDNARKKLLFNKVFEYYKLKPNQRDFPILSILQHYGAPTPLMDWSYNVDVALYFATEGVKPSSSKDIELYFSIYEIDKNKQIKNEFNNLLNWHKGSFPKISSFFGWEDNQNSIFYISDFEDKPENPRSFVDERPITTFYNQNIIPQEGLFIFNPFPKKPLENCFNTDHDADGNNLDLIPFSCFNINKDLSEYIRRKIKLKGIDNAFIYPDLRVYCNGLIEEFLDQAAEAHNK